MKVIEFLDNNSVKYELTQHRPTFTAQQMAAEEHVPGMTVAKPVLVQADGQYYMCVLPACCKIDLDKLKELLNGKELMLGSEDQMAKIFTDCELGAEPPIGSLYDLTTIMDKTLEADEFIVFQAGTHDKAVKVSMADYKKLVEPKVMSFSYHSR
jgi:Ala-tRNA(Pro) deacylase